VDTEAYQFWISKVTERFQWLRVLFSNAISIPIDTLIFVWGAFGGKYAGAVIWSIFLANLLLKGATTIASLPLIYLVREKKQPQHNNQE